jgi:3-oxoacid CoA-transferase subunit A
MTALAGVLRDGMTIMSGGFGLCGNAESCIDADRAQRHQEPDHHQQQLRQPGPGAGGAAQEPPGVARDLQLRRRQPGSRRAVSEGDGQGRAVAAGDVRRTHPRRRRGIAGFYTPTGVGTVVAEGKEVREIDGKKYLFERPLRADLAIVRAAVGDVPATCAFTARRATSTR